MGDVAMTVPVLQCVKDANDVRLTVITRPFLTTLFRDIPAVETFGADLQNTYKGFWGIVRLYRHLRKLKIDEVADIHDVLRSKILRNLFRMGGIRIQVIDKGRAEKKALTRAKNKIFQPLQTTTERYADVFRKLGLSVDLQNFKPLQAAWDESLEVYCGSKSSPWIGIAPFAQHAGKVYPSDLMQWVIDDLAKESVTLFLFGGGKDEQARLQNYAGAKKNCKVVAGAFSFAEELSLIAQLDVMLSMDSANGHLAANYGVPVISLWGATHPYAGFAPFGQPETHSLIADRLRYPDLPTSVYGNKMPEGYEEAMRTIDPRDVVEKIKEVLVTHRRNRPRE